MTSFNLSVCIAPSLLWPLASAGPSPQADATRKVAEILQFMVDHCNEIFDEACADNNAWYMKGEQKPEGDEIADESDNSTCQDNAMVPGSELTSEKLQSENDEADIEDISHFNRSGMIRRRLFRRRSQSTCERMERLSRNSMEQEINEKKLIHNEQRNLKEVHHTNERTDGCSMSNDSGFTTLSGEDEDTSLSNSTRTKIDNSDDRSDVIESTVNSTEQSLSNFWGPSKDKIVDEMEGKRILNSDGNLSKSASEDKTQTQLQFVDQEVQKLLSVGQTVEDPPSALRSHKKEYDGLQLSFPVTTQRLTYMRLQDGEDKNFKTQNSDSKRGSKRETRGLHEEYLRYLRNQDSNDVVQNLSGQVEFSCINVNECVDNNNPEPARPNTLKFSFDGTRNAIESSSNSLEKDDHEESNHAHSKRTSLPPTALSRQANSLRQNCDHTSGFIMSQSYSFSEGNDFGVMGNRSPAPLSPIQKLTENLNSIPNFRHKTFLNQKRLDQEEGEVVMPYDRTKSSPVMFYRAHYHTQSRGLQAHYLKLKTSKKMNGTRQMVGHNDNNRETRHLTRRVEKKPVVDNCVFTRRRRNRLQTESTASLSRYYNFSKNLHSGNLKQSRVKTSQRSPENQLETSISRSKTDNQQEKVISPETAKVSLETDLCNPAEPESLNVSVKSRVHAFDQLIHNHSSHSEPSLSQRKNNETASHKDASHKDLTVVSSPRNPSATFVHLESMLVDFHPKITRGTKNGSSRRTKYPNSLEENRTDASNNNLSFENRKWSRCFISRKTPDMEITSCESKVLPENAASHTTISEDLFSEKKTGRLNKIGTVRLPAPLCASQGENGTPFKGFEKVLHSEESYV